MSDPAYSYRKDQELPAIPLAWYDRNGALIDFSSGWTFTVKLAKAATPTTVALTKTTGITGAATDPNLLIDWSTSDWSALDADPQGTVYVVWVYARRNSDSKDRVYRPKTGFPITLLPAAA